MKSTLLAFLVLGLTADSAFTQADRATQRARELSNQNNVRQGVPPPAPPPTPPAAAPASPSVPKPATLTTQQSIAKIQADMAAFKPGGTATAEQKQQLTKDIALSIRGKKPALPTVKTFVESLTAALANATLDAPQQTRLAQNIETVLNSAGMASNDYEKVIADVQAILQVGTIKRNAAIAVAGDLKAIGTEVRR